MSDTASGGTVSGTVATIARRFWPAALAVAMAGTTMGGGGPEQVTALAQALSLLPLLYLLVETFRWRRWSWAVLAALLASFTVVEAVDVVDPAAVVAGVALAVLVWGGVRGRLFRSRDLQIQALGMIGFGAVALTGLIIDPDAGRYIVAAGWLVHGLWDLVYIKLDKVVLRSYAQWCFVVDVLIAASLVIVL
ncbi:hypothetical protein E1287_12485 [Actinomadura sp. KC06]|uniref:hypothetical protein n=1 Tax=Actinomadura sp. KC06 TaxID=2530369 RepID=UPI001053B78E|nr:hypothetical protein [Actinomadura sp. KC06]TDD35980.1 hypothetical protein E1287_12485 [Actinomadura sp. KC06]